MESINDVLNALYGRKKYKGKLEGLEDELPQFKSKSIILYSGRKMHGGGGRRKSKHRTKLIKRRLPIYFD